MPKDPTENSASNDEIGNGRVAIAGLFHGNKFRL